MPQQPVTSAGAVLSAPWSPPPGEPFGSEHVTVMQTPSVRVGPSQHIEATLRCDITGNTNYKITCSNPGVLNQTDIYQTVDGGTGTCTVELYALFAHTANSTEMMTFKVEAWFDGTGDAAAPRFSVGAALIVEVYDSAVQYVAWRQQSGQVPASGNVNPAVDVDFQTNQLAEAKASLLLSAHPSNAVVSLGWTNDSGTQLPSQAADGVPLGPVQGDMAPAARENLTPVPVAGTCRLHLKVTNGSGSHVTGAVVYARVLEAGTQVVHYSASKGTTVQAFLATLTQDQLPQVQLLTPLGMQTVEMGTPSFGLDPNQLSSPIESLVPAVAATSSGSLTIVVPNVHSGGGEQGETGM